jgi:hypothetical protein
VRLAARFSYGKLLTAGSYTLTAISTDSTHAVGPARTAKLAVIVDHPARRPARR